VDGILDLRDWRFADGAVPLDGRWMLRYGELLGPELLEGTSPAPPFAFEPGSWNGTREAGRALGGTGVATHALRILLPPGHPRALSLLFGEAYSADRLFANGALVSERGHVARDHDVPDPRPRTVRFSVETDTLDLVLQISNHFHHDGGLIRTPLLGPTPLIETLMDRQVKQDFFILGCLGVLGLYYVILFATRPEPALLLFSFLTLLVALRLATTGWYLNDVLPLGAEGQLRLDYTTLYIAPAVYYAFVRALFPRTSSQWVFKISAAVAMIGTATSVLLPTAVFTGFLPVAMIGGVLVPVAASYALFVAVASGEEGAIPLLLAALVVVVVVGHDAWARAGMVATLWNGIAIASLLLVFAHAAALGVRLSRGLALSESLRGSLEELNRNLEARIAERTATLERVAGTDPLTGVHNRRSLALLAEAERSGAHRQQHDFSLAIVDIDHFKEVNDTRGHGAGDMVLSRLASELASRVRAHDVIGRYGGDEFVVVLPYLGEDEAAGAAERFRQELAQISFPSAQGEPFRVTVSIGVATAGREESFEAVLKRADEALYAAKSAGRNRVARAAAPGR
jgi:diguanylate cyclase (GGDEF)-like protein